MASEMGVNIAILNSGAIKGSFDPLKHNGKNIGDANLFKYFHKVSEAREFFLNFFPPVGDVTMGDIYEAMPWSNTIDTVTMSGHTLKEVLEHAVAKYDANHPDPGGRFLQVHGLSLTYDVRQKPRHRLVKAETVDQNQKRERISDTKKYEVAMPSFLALGGDRFTMIPESTIEYKNTGFLDNDLLEAYLRKNNPLKLPKAGRIVVISEETASSAPTLQAKGYFPLVSIFVAIAVSTKISSISA